MPRLSKPSAPPTRLSPGALTTLGWCAVPAFALLLYGTLPRPTHPVFLARDHFLAPSPGLVVAVAVVMALPIGWAVRWPLPALGLLLAEAVAARVFGTRCWPLFLAADVLVFHLAVTCTRRASVAGLVGVLTGWAVVAAAFVPAGRIFAVLTGPSSGLAVIAVAAWILGSWIRLRQDHAEELRAQVAVQAVQAERLRIARELHDMVAHNIGAIAIQAGAARRVIETQPTGARDALGVIEATSRETLTGLRHLLGALREADDGAVGPAPGAPVAGLADLDRLVAGTAEAGVRVEIRRMGRPRPLAAEIESSAFRIIQESVTNVVRHAGADHCRVSVDYGVAELALEIVDDGCGGGGDRAPGLPGSGYGIAGMRERVALLHGWFSSGPRPEGGFRVAAGLPI
ncbi:sensor histidine kinase [Embleya hyalina]|uniref:histidine kinase n=1 Tax=Embleya hyalina TaxID=516124 RepID=A0A401YJW8_9ACTN|nr:histidine kinase [Embleya hyalina]GCD94886.1 two-component sensor histidine kinase [Embleya hyalina]